MKETEIAALITLLDDDDHEVVAHVWNKIKSIGPSIVPVLENSWNPDYNPTQSERLEDLIHEIQFESLVAEIDTWINAPTQDLKRGYFLISKYFFPEIDEAVIDSKIAKIRQKIWIELNNQQTPFEQIQIFNQVIYDHLGFKGDLNSSTNSDFCLNHILETKRANPISMGLLYIIVAQSLHLPIFGVLLKGYFVLAFCKSNHLAFGDSDKLMDDVLFYLNPFQQGIIFSKAQIDDYLKRTNIPSEPKYYIPADNRENLKELLRYLIVVNERNEKSNPSIFSELKVLLKKISR